MLPRQDQPPLGVGEVRVGPERCGDCQCDL